MYPWIGAVTLGLEAAERVPHRGVRIHLKLMMILRPTDLRPISSQRHPVTEGVLIPLRTAFEGLIMLKLACISAGVASALAMLAGHPIKGLLLAVSAVALPFWLRRR